MTRWVKIPEMTSFMGYKVGLMDADIHGPDVPRMLGLDGMLSADLDNRS